VTKYEREHIVDLVRTYLDAIIAERNEKTVEYYRKRVLRIVKDGLERSEK